MRYTYDIIESLEVEPELEAELKMLIDTINDTEADRDRWKARAEALERAINMPNCNNPECAWYHPCDTCKSDPDSCDYLCDGNCVSHICLGEPCPHWQFDESRFAGKEDADA